MSHYRKIDVRVWLIIKNYAEFPDPDRSVSDVLQEISGGVT